MSEELFQLHSGPVRAIRRVFRQVLSIPLALADLWSNLLVNKFALGGCQKLRCSLGFCI